MKESISYSFLLNTIILFIFVCSSIIAGIFSYYRAFRANTIIVNEIEKYEGFNCLSLDSISKKLSGISYSVPFNVQCKSNYGGPCKTDNETNGNYAVVSYNLDFNDDEYYAYNDIMDASATDSVWITKKYQYGVYTYMYIDLPVVSQIVRIPFFSKTKQMYDFRNLKAISSLYPSDQNYNQFIDYDTVPSEIKNDTDSKINVAYASYLLENYTESTVSKRNLKGKLFSVDDGYDIRDAFTYTTSDDVSDSQDVLKFGKKSCGFTYDWSQY